MEGRKITVVQPTKDHYVSDQESGQEGDYEDKSVYSDFKEPIADLNPPQVSRDGRTNKTAKKNNRSKEPDYIKAEHNINEIDKVILQMNNRNNLAQQVRANQRNRNFSNEYDQEEEEKNERSSNELNSYNSNNHLNSLVVELHTTKMLNNPTASDFENNSNSYKVHSNNSPDDLSMQQPKPGTNKKLKWILVCEPSEN